jgi:beta-glucanase (GH16 family)
MSISTTNSKGFSLKNMSRISFIITVLIFIAIDTTTAQCPKLVWQDEFEKTTLDSTKWSFQIGDGCDINLCGWGNNELQWYQSENVELSDGVLQIIAKKENVRNKPYTSARIRTLGKGDWTYGRFEASIKLPEGKGLWPAFWMLPTDKVYGGWPQSGEVDIVELIGDEPDKVHGTIHFGKPWPNNNSLQKSYHLNNGIFNDEYHTFAVEWEEGEIRWLLDDYVYSTIRPEDLAPNAWPFNQSFHVLLNLAVGGRWPGNPDATITFPQTMEVDYVRVYDGFFPSITGSHQVEKNSKALKYTIHNVPEKASFVWTIPDDAKLLEGQGTHQIIVKWGETGGDIKVKIIDECNTKEIILNVLTIEPVVKKPVTKINSIKNFDSPSLQMKHEFSSGNYMDGVKNPAPNDINSSQLSGKYIRNKGSRYDVMVYRISDLNPAEFVEGESIFFIDIYTNAPPGTEILVQLENSTIATGSNYPQGRHSRFHTFTTKQNKWERLELTFQNQPDSSIKSKDVNQFIILFAPNSNSSDIFYFDNFDVYSSKASLNPKK